MTRFRFAQREETLVAQASRDPALNDLHADQDLQDYQKKLDDARTRVKEGNLTETELDRMDKELEKSMPKAVRDIVQRNEAQHQQFGKEGPSQDTTELSPDSPPRPDRPGVATPSQAPGMG